MFYSTRVCFRAHVNTINMCGDKPTLNDGKQDNNNEEEEGNIKEDSVSFQRISIRRFQLVADTTSSTNAFIQVEYEALKIC